MSPPDTTIEELAAIRSGIEALLGAFKAYAEASLAILSGIEQALAGTSPPAQMTLTIGGTMPITVDSTNAQAILSFEDDKNDPVPAPSGAVSTATSSDTAVMTVGAQAAGTDAKGNATIVFPLTPVAAGSVTLSIHTTAAGGTALLGPDGTTPIPDPQPVTVAVDPGAPAQEVFTTTP